MNFEYCMVVDSGRRMSTMFYSMTSPILDFRGSDARSCHRMTKWLSPSVVGDHSQRISRGRYQDEGLLEKEVEDPHYPSSLTLTIRCYIANCKAQICLFYNFFSLIYKIYYKKQINVCLCMYTYVKEYILILEIFY